MVKKQANLVKLLGGLLVVLGLLILFSCENIEKDGPIQDWQVEPRDETLYRSGNITILSE